MLWGTPVYENTSIWKTPVLKPLFKRPATLLKRDTNTGVFL